VDPADPVWAPCAVAPAALADLDRSAMDQEVPDRHEAVLEDPDRSDQGPLLDLVDLVDPDHSDRDLDPSDKDLVDQADPNVVPEDRAGPNAALEDQVDLSEDLEDRADPNEAPADPVDPSVDLREAWVLLEDQCVDLADPWEVQASEARHCGVHLKAPGTIWAR